MSDRKLAEIDTIGMFTPITFIYDKKDNRDTLLDSIARHNLISGIDELFPARIAIRDIETNSDDLSRILFSLMDNLDKGNNTAAAPLLRYVLDAMEAKHINYALAVSQIGSSPGDSFMSWSLVRCVIIDRQKKNVAVFASSKADHSDPMPKSNTDAQLKKMFEQYFATH